ncbi:MAG: hypothetical protein WC010_03695 [Candidatus Absconditabacterales bacterium]
MNILQEIIEIFLKITHYEDLFKSSFPNGLTKSEVDFKETFQYSFLRDNLKIRKMKDRSFVLIWKSRSLEIIALPISDKEIFFSRMEIYHKQDRCMAGNINHYFETDMDAKIELEKEVQEIKTIFLSYSPQAAEFFK